MGFLVLNVLPKPAPQKGVIVESPSLRHPSFPADSWEPHPLALPGFRAAVVDGPSPLFPRCRGICSLPGPSLGGTPQPPAVQGSVAKCPTCPASSGTVLSCIPHSWPEGPTEMSPSHPQGRLINAPFLVSLPSLFSSPPPSFLFPEITCPQNYLHPKPCLRRTPGRHARCHQLLAEPLRPVPGTHRHICIRL